MSATKRSDVRVEMDFYRTEPWVTGVILDELAPRVGARVYEPCAGDGAIVRVLLKRGFVVEAVELHPGRYASLNTLEAHAGGFLLDAVQGDVLVYEPVDRPDVIITNPPYSIAQKVAERCLSIVKPEGTVALLLPLDFLASKGRGPFLETFRPDVYILSPRPSFRTSIKWSVMVKIIDPVTSKPKTKTLWSSPSEEEAQQFIAGLTYPATCKRVVTSHDSAEYAWFVWGFGRTGRWFRLEKP